ncbi:hypothetical protein CJU89_0795 [Yarrowia sp. B02]|nr:hypothetical protein CJU89_0795 [Yarrowia sp. B02]
MDFFSPYSTFGGYGNDDYGYYSRPQPRRQSRQQQMLRRQEAQRQAEAREYARREAEARAYHKKRQEVYRQQQREAEAQRQAEARAYYDELARQQQKSRRKQYAADPFAQFFGMNHPSALPFHNFDESEDEYATQDVAMTSPTASESNTDVESDSDNDVFYDSLESAEPSDDEEESDDEESDSESVELPPTVVVYSTPQPAEEKNVSKRLQKMAPVIERHVDTFDRIKKAASGSSDSDDYESLLNATKSRLKVIQNAQMKLEQLYDQLDSIKTDNKKDKAMRTALIKKSVGTAEAIDSVVQALKEQRNYYKQCLEEDSESDSSADSASDTSSSDIVYHVTLEEVPDSDFSELSE